MLLLVSASPTLVSANWCTCMLHAARADACSTRHGQPAWLREHTGKQGELHFRLQDWAWGNTMMALRDALLVALILDRRPVLRFTPETTPLNGANLSSALELHNLDTIVEPLTERYRVGTPGNPAAVLITVDHLRRIVHHPSATLGKVVYTRLLPSFATVQQQQELARLAREMRGRAAWADLLLDPVPDCWPSAFIRPAARVRAHVLPLVESSAAAVHLRLCTLVGWKDTCKGTKQPHAAARDVIGCAVGVAAKRWKKRRLGRASSAAVNTTAPMRLFVASDSSIVLDALQRDANAGNLSLHRAAAPSAVASLPPRGLQFAAMSGLGRATHLSKSYLRPAHEVDAQTSFDRAVFDWAAFAYSRRVVGVPSSFSASAVCMWQPRDVDPYVVLRMPPDGSPINCDRPFASSRGARGAHPCRDVQRVNWGGQTNG